MTQPVRILALHSRHLWLLMFTTLLTGLSCVGCGGSLDSQSGLETIGNACLNYQSTRRDIVPAIVTDSAGQPMHSWRTIVTPFVEANRFTEAYDINSAWNSDANQDLVSGTRRYDDDKFPDPTSIRMAYQTHKSHPSARHHTNYFMVLDREDAVEPIRGYGPHAADSYKSWQAIFANDRKTIMIVALDESDVHWMEPRDIVLHPADDSTMIAYEDIKHKITASVEFANEVAVTNDLTNDVTYHDRDTTIRILDALSSEVNN